VGVEKRIESFVERHWYLDRIEALRSLTAQEKAFFLEQTTRRRFGRGACIFSPGDPGVSVFMIQEGKVKIYALTEEGQEVTYWYCHPGEMFGLAEVCGEEERACYAEAVVDTAAVEIPHECLKTLIGNNPTLAEQFIKVLGARLRQACDTIKELATADVPSRLAHLLVKLAQISGSPHPGGGLAIDDRLTHQELANMIGASRQTVTEILNRFKEEGTIAIEGRKIILTHPGRFAALTSSRE
jgi:CRP-like cAMP-binding protein